MDKVPGPVECGRQDSCAIPQCSSVRPQALPKCPYAGTPGWLEQAARQASIRNLQKRCGYAYEVCNIEAQQEGSTVSQLHYDSVEQVHVCDNIQQGHTQFSVLRLSLHHIFSMWTGRSTSLSFVRRCKEHRM